MSRSSSSLSQRLALYTSAAGATVMAGSAMAAVVDANISLTLTASSPDTGWVGDSELIDITGDGTDNFRFGVFDRGDGYGGSACGGAYFEARWDANSAVAEVDGYSGYAQLIAPGTEIPGSLDFAQSSMGYLFGDCYDTGFDGEFPPGTRGFIGLRFEVDGETHYGYADVEVQRGSHIGIVHSVFFEDQPDTPIVAGGAGAPAPAPLAVPVGGAVPLGLLLLAAGAAALRRRNRQMAA